MAAIPQDRAPAPKQVLDTFDPANPFGDEPVPAMAQEIDMLAGEFAKLGVSAHSAVPLWLGKPNRFTSIVMTSAQQVLDYIAAELAAQAKARAEAGMDSNAHPTARALQADAGADAGVVSTSTPLQADRATKRAQYVQAVQAANDAWREAIRLRSKALMEWDSYVEGARREYQRVKGMKP